MPSSSTTQCGGPQPVAPVANSCALLPVQAERKESLDWSRKGYRHSLFFKKICCFTIIERLYKHGTIFVLKPPPSKQDSLARFSETCLKMGGDNGDSALPNCRGATRRCVLSVASPLGRHKEWNQRQTAVICGWQKKERWCAAAILVGGWVVEKKKKAAHNWTTE